MPPSPAPMVRHRVHIGMRRAACIDLLILRLISGEDCDEVQSRARERGESPDAIAGELAATQQRASAAASPLSMHDVREFVKSAAGEL